MPDLTSQPTAAPTRKVAAGGIGGAIGVLLVGAADQFLHWKLSTEEAAAVVLVCSALPAYITRETA